MTVIEPRSSPMSKLKIPHNAFVFVAMAARLSS